jgi:DNA-binding transcriptional MerR regulator
VVGVEAERPDEWRIDELAHRSTTSVDTIRFYQREGLLPQARRVGRATVFGPAHLIRIQQIRELQARHFSLGAIKTLLADNRLGVVEAVFAAGEGAYPRSELPHAAGLSAELVHKLESVGILADPAETGRTAYDNGDIQALRAVGQLIELGLPEGVVVELAGIYNEQFEVMQRRAAELFAEAGRNEWPPETRAAFEATAVDNVGSIMALTERLLDYLHHRTVQRMTLASLRVSDRVSDRSG